MTSRLAAAAALLVACGALAADAPEPAKPDAWWNRARPVVRNRKPLDDARGILAGSFTSREQSRLDPDYFDVALRVVPVWLHRGDGRWLYLEEALEGASAEPLRQRVLQLVWREKDDTVELRRFKLPTPSLFAGAGDDPERFDVLSLEDLVPEEGCAFPLTYAEGIFRGSTAGHGCAGDSTGVAYVTSEVELSAEALRIWDRGYDAEGRQIWGATKGPYVFRRVTTP